MNSEIIIMSQPDEILAILNIIPCGVLIPKLRRNHVIPIRRGVSPFTDPEQTNHTIYYDDLDPTRPNLRDIVTKRPTTIQPIYVSGRSKNGSGLQESATIWIPTISF